MKKQTLGMTIADLRKKNGMTQLELAEKMGVTDKAVSKWERDLSCPDINTLPKLAELFGVSMDELMQLKEDGSEKSNEFTKAINLVFRVIPLAMGVAVVVLSILKSIDSGSAFIMLGIGLACVGITLVQEHSDKE